MSNPSLASQDAHERHEAMHGLDTRALSATQLRAKTKGWEALSLWWLAVCSGRNDLRDVALEQLPAFEWNKASTDQQHAVLRVAQVGLVRGGTFSSEAQAWFEQKWNQLTVASLRWELSKLLIYFKTPGTIAKATDYLKTATTSEDLLFYPMHLRYLKDGWTLEQRRVVFDALNRAEKLNGASSYFKAIADTRAELAAALTPEDAKTLADVITASQAPLSAHALPSHSFKQWKLADLVPMLDKASKGRSFESAKKALVGAQCVFCHRVSAGNELPAGIIGPDLTQVSARFGRKDLLMHILEPSVFIDEKFRSTVITKTDGTQAIGMFESEDDERVVLKPNPLTKDVIETAKAQIKERKMSEISPMPPGLLNVLKPDQILDMLAWFEAGGDPKKPVWTATP